MKVFPFGIGSFEPLAPEPEVAHQLAKGTKEKSQTQADEEYGKREDDNRGDAAAFISPNRGPCCTTQQYYAYCYFYQSHNLVNSETGLPKKVAGSPSFARHHSKMTDWL
jgi:hypothetical protein